MLAKVAKSYYNTTKSFIISKEEGKEMNPCRTSFVSPFVLEYGNVKCTCKQGRPTPLGSILSSSPASSSHSVVV